MTDLTFVPESLNSATTSKDLLPIFYCYYVLYRDRWGVKILEAGSSGLFQDTNPAFAWTD